MNAQQKCNPAVIFDLDGTLMDTKSGILASLAKALKIKNLEPVPEEEKDRYIGPPMCEALQTVYGLPQEEAGECSQLFRQIYSGPDSLVADLYPGLCTLLENLQSHGFKLIVATYKREDIAKKMIEHFGLSKYFDGVFGSDLAASITKAEIVKKAMDFAEASGNTSIMVGDSSSDGKSAHANGCSFIAVTYGFGFPTQKSIDEMTPDAVCKDTLSIEQACLDIFEKKGIKVRNNDR